MIISQSRSDYILFAQQIIFTDCLNKIFDFSIRVSRSFRKLGDMVQQTFGRGWALPGMTFGYTTVMSLIYDKY